MLTGTFLKKRREDRKMNRAEAAERLGVAYNTLQNWERGLSTPGSRSLRKLRSLYHFDMEEYLGYYRNRLYKEADRKVNLLRRNTK